ncbi:hypothetical protein DM860_002710 [Cuscuta australis]|uniref:feruloyl-CoA 6-hydroxylase n=1 Tax=Cuscuta australis TaxID=267555 RepID=A0A328CZ42_9ASTE|nr:hypothetical protein DM860_002710 [Cuscuta australis]
MDSQQTISSSFSSSSSTDLPQHQESLKISKSFLWPEQDLAPAHEELNEPVIDLESYYAGGDQAEAACELVRAACASHGLFQVVNHGVDLDLIRQARDCSLAFFKLPAAEKFKAEKRHGSLCGYSSANAERFTSRLPWKETLTLLGFGERCGDRAAVDFFTSSFGPSYENVGLVFEKYCEAMKELSMRIVEMLGRSLKVDPSYYREYFVEGVLMLKCNFYPRCAEPEFTLGTGPHRDTNSHTILYQDDQVQGLQVFVDNQWKLVRPISHALVVAMGDTFQALTNKMYKSCLHRAVVNNEQERLSLAFFISPAEGKPIKAPEDLISTDKPRLYPEFTWSNLLYYIQNHYRADDATLQNFCKWLQST